MCVDGLNFGEVGWQFNRGQCHADAIDQDLRQAMVGTRTPAKRSEPQPDPALCGECQAGVHGCYRTTKASAVGDLCRCTDCRPF